MVTAVIIQVPRPSRSMALRAILTGGSTLRGNTGHIGRVVGTA